MALEIPQDLPRDPFTRAGLFNLNGDTFQGGRTVSTHAFLEEIRYVKANVVQRALRSQGEWQRVRDVVIHWCYSYQTLTVNDALNAFFRYVDLPGLDITTDTLAMIFGAIEARHDQADPEPSPRSGWMSQRPVQRLPSTVNPRPLPTLPPTSQPLQVVPPRPSPSTVPTIQTTTRPSQPSLPNSTIPTNSRSSGLYTFNDHKQEYRGYQFQCIFRCLKGGKHCRKAPVREMNRHLRKHHHFRQGFKIAGVDWEQKRWRGAGADHEECFGRLVVKDCPDDIGDDEDELYVVR